MGLKQTIVLVTPCKDCMVAPKVEVSKNLCKISCTKCPATTSADTAIQAQVKWNRDNCFSIQIMEFI
jgi:hypothetical protein